jgi:hypothetical protein
MTRPRVAAAAIPLFLAAGAASCDTRFAQTALEPARTDAATTIADARSDRASPACGATLASRLRVSRVALSDDVRYRRQGYNRLAEDERIAFSIDPSGAPSVAWLDDAGQHVHVTALDATLQRRGADAVVAGIDVGGLVAQPDGAAVLLRRDDPGQPLPDPAASFQIAKAAVVVRVRQGVEQAALPLTGTSSIVATTVGAARDCAASPLNGRLEWNGTRYGAYFVIHGCEGDAHASFYGDKLAYFDDSGNALPGGFSWGCSIDEGLRLLPEQGPFTPLCISDGSPAPGLNLVVEDTPPVLLSPEASAVGYSAGRLGSIVKMSDGTFVVGWLSRGVQGNGPSAGAAKSAPDIALLHLDGNQKPVGPVVSVTNTPLVAEAGLHLAAYGMGRLLAVWQTFEDLDCNEQTCFGTFTGTHARLMNPDGQFTTPDELIQATPNDQEDIRAFANGDLGFAYVEVGDRSVHGELPLGDGGVPSVPAVRMLSIARLHFCE